MTDQDPTTPVVLQEPTRPVRAANPDGPTYVLQPEEPLRLDLHPGWAPVLARDETPLWVGQAAADPGISTIGRLMRRPVFVMALGLGAVLVLQNMDLGWNTDEPLLIWPLLGLLFWLVRRTKGQPRVARAYLLTDRAAYLARLQGGKLADVTAYPVTAAMHLGLGPHSVSFATRRDAKGRIEAEGFLDIPDAPVVHDMIRDLQKGQT